jgi:hypothetical protein
MNFDVLYQIAFLNGNYIKGKVNVRLGQDIKSLKKRIL